MLLEFARRRWTREIRPRLPRWFLRRLASLSRVLGVEARLLHWLVPSSPEDGLSTATPDTPPAIHASLGRIATVGLPGDYCEFGLYRGYTFWFAQQSANLHGLVSMRSFGFDSFRGLPRPEGVDGDSQEFKEGDYACSRQEVEDRLSRFGFDWSRATLVDGFYDESLSPDLYGRLEMGPVALALVDCDLYESTVPVLRFLQPLLQDGTILLFDDWNCFGASDRHGQRRAFGEFLESNPEWKGEAYFRFGWHGQAFVLRRRRSTAEK